MKMEKLKNNRRVKPASSGVIAFALFLLCITVVNSTKLRHSRHLDTKSIYDFKVQQGKTHNHKPIFSYCSNYTPVIKEEEPSGTIVVHVTAEDKDPPEEGGTITYGFVTAPGEKIIFEINNKTGLIRTTQSLDRDEPERMKEVYLTVLATDNGRPQLDDVCTFKVTVEDVNDNAPVFDKADYIEYVPQDLLLGSKVLGVSATDRDDGENSVVRYSLRSKKSDDSESYFRIDAETGVIYLNKTIDKNPDYKFMMEATAKDQGKPPRYSTIDLDIIVVESNKKPPSFLYKSAELIKLPENFSDFDGNIATMTATSNIPDSPDILFYLIPKGKRNEEYPFRLESANNTAYIKLAHHLDYENTTEYTLILRVQNKYNLTVETSFIIQVLDVNDNIPRFKGPEKGSVLENEPPGVPVMQVRATDADGTSAHNQITYELDNYKNFFTIDKYTGNVTTLKTFDREEVDSYNIKVLAIDNSPSALFKSGEHNKGQQVFRIEIADKNDNPPHFNQSYYVANSILENANINEIVIEVKAEDADTDTASPVLYSIISGNINNSFVIESTTGKIRVNQPLDYEKITEYTLIVEAFDGLFNDTAQVKIFIENVNDNPPVFGNFDTNPIIEEEKLVEGCITTVVAYDPDIKDRNVDQNITYELHLTYDKLQTFIDIDKTGCLKLKKPLDRDSPNGYPTWTVRVIARDENGITGSHKISTEVNITLLDINDNAPFLDMPYPVIWDENKAPGKIITLKAQDYDDPETNGMFYFEIDYSADEEITSKFLIKNKDLYALVKFDREERKSYNIPISITDSGTPSMTGVSMLTVIIGDINDNPMKSGASSIFVYNYKGEAPDSEIGRVYVDDPDDWDLPDKKFSWASSHDGFQLNPETGVITLLSGVTNKSLTLKFRVKEQSNYFVDGPAEITVEAIVNVTIKEIPKEAVDKSGSVRFYGMTAEEFIMPFESELSKKDLFQHMLANILNVSIENVDVFTVLHSPHHNNKSLLDVRFSAHGSPYYAPEKLNTILSQHVYQIEQKLEAEILLINVDECLEENLHCENSCRSYLNVSAVPSSVFTNVTSFVGVRAVVDPQCTCHVAEPIVCLNKGTLDGDKCKCPPGYEGKRCELLAIGFHGDGWAIMPPPGQACDASHLGFEITPHSENGLIFYFGPMNYFPKLGIQDFMAMELQNGYAVLYMDYGTGTIKLDQKRYKLTDGKSHRIDVYFTNNSIDMKIDNCELSACVSLTAPLGSNKFLNVNNPMQVGGTLSNLTYLGHSLGWNYIPTLKGFEGCIRNMIFNVNTYNLGEPAMSKNADLGCNHGMAKAVTFGIKKNFLVAIAVCAVTLFVLLLAVVVHKKRTDDLYKDMDDIRENIINYDDEGGGEVDTGYDLNVLRAMYDPSLDSKLTPIGLQTRGQNEVPDICGFLDVRKESCDKDPDTNPFDDVRHYAYEGEGNSDGSLSSLASCTDDGDLKFNYLSNFGPRFRKLADMYGEQPSDEESEGVCERESESWC